MKGHFIICEENQKIDTNTFINSDGFKDSHAIETRGFSFGMNRQSFGRKSRSFVVIEQAIVCKRGMVRCYLQ